jgi:hypothetical protein
LLPDHLAARFPGTLGEIEAVVAEVERARSVEAAANALRPDDVTLATALRWIRRRLRLVHAVLRVVVSLLPDLCLGSAPTVRSVRARLGCVDESRLDLRGEGWINSRRHRCPRLTNGAPARVFHQGPQSHR